MYFCDSCKWPLGSLEYFDKNNIGIEEEDIPRLAKFGIPPSSEIYSDLLGYVYEKKCPKCHSQCRVEHRCTFEENPEDVKDKGIGDMIDYQRKIFQEKEEELFADKLWSSSKERKTKKKEERDIVFRMTFKAEYRYETQCIGSIYFTDLLRSLASNKEEKSNILKHKKEFESYEKDWKCNQCSEHIESIYDICWNCENQRDKNPFL